VRLSRRLVDSRAAVPTAADLAAVPLFASLGEAELAELAGRFEQKTIGPGARLVGEDASGYSFFVLLEGTAAVTVDGYELRSLGPGDYFGEVALLDGGRRTATVTTTSPATVLVLFGTEFRRLQQTQPEIAARIEATMRERTATG
jgi:CRP/FNR family transcriptional regulator, cyclic AMP receptor protein